MEKSKVKIKQILLSNGVYVYDNKGEFSYYGDSYIKQKIGKFTHYFNMRHIIEIIEED